MIIIPEIEAVMILTPRTASGSLRRAIAERYPKSILLYRHMEADGVPAGYDRWCRFGIVRDPVDRLWSLFKFLSTFGDTEHQRRHSAGYISALRASVAGRSFEGWMLNNEVVFTSPYDRAGTLAFWPEYTVRHALPENRKSQFLYLRPDLGTEVFRYDQLGGLIGSLDLPADYRCNATASAPAPELSKRGRDYVEQRFAWDLAACAKEKTDG